MLSLNMLIFSLSQIKTPAWVARFSEGARKHKRGLWLIMHFNTNLNVSDVSTSCFRFCFVFNEAFSFDSLPFFTLSDFFSIILKLLVARSFT